MLLLDAVPPKSGSLGRVVVQQDRPFLVKDNAPPAPFIRRFKEETPMSLRIVAIGTFLALFAGNVLSAERVGSTIEAQSTVSGEGAVGKRVIARADPIYRDERLRSNLTGLGQFQLGDGTKLVLGRNASLVIDRYVIGGGSKAKTITLKLISGSARFVTGASDKRAYRILTPQGTIGVRGTAFDLTVRNGKTHLLLLSKTPISRS